MRIYSLSKVLSVPVALAGLYLGYEILYNYSALPGWLLLIPLVSLVAIWLFQGQIDHWYLESYPPNLDDEIKAWLGQYDSFYQQLSLGHQKRMEQRIALYVQGRSFQIIRSRDMEDLPYDISCFIAAQAVKLTLHQEDYLHGDLDRIYVHSPPFSEPNHQQLHTVETQIEDGVLLFALHYLLKGMTHPSQYFPIGLYGYADAYVKVHPEHPWPDTCAFNWREIEALSGFTKQAILSALGYTAIDLLPVYIAYLFLKPTYLEQINAAVYQRLTSIFRLHEE